MTANVDDALLCRYCHGIGYLMRPDDKSMVKCICCEGTGHDPQTKGGD